jgi:hypothetical protein
LKNVFLILICLTVILPLIILTPSYIKASGNELMFFRKDSSPYGIPYSEWLKIWWHYWVGIPNNEHPAVNYDSKTCSVHQQGPVWFLPDVVAKGNDPYTLREFSCEIPKDKAIFFPLSQSSCWLGNPEFKDVRNKLASDPKVDADLKTCAVSPQDYTQFPYVRIDGKNLDTTKLDRATTSFYNVTVPSNPVTSIFDFGPPGTSRGIADGYSLFLSPLHVGKHLIEFKAVDQLAGPASPKLTREGKYTVFIK